MIVRFDEIGDGISRRIEADEMTRARLAKRFDLEAITALSADVDLAMVDGAPLVAGRVRGRAVSPCSVSAEPVTQDVDEALANRAYENVALPIGHGQTISQPYIVARMTELLLDNGTPNKVLEIGAGCGYQSAILSQVAKRVFSIEYLEPLYTVTKQRLRKMGFHNVRLRCGDGRKGWPAEAPFDAILAAAAPAEVPQALIDQLAPGGRLVMPVGGDRGQVLRVIDRRAGKLSISDLDAVTFVPLVDPDR